MHLKGEVRKGDTFGLSAKSLFSHTFQTQRLHALCSTSQGNCLQITWRECYWAWFIPNLRICCELWKEVMFLFSDFCYSLRCWKAAIWRWCSCCSKRTVKRGRHHHSRVLPTWVLPNDNHFFKDAVRSPIFLSFSFSPFFFFFLLGNRWQLDN